MAQSDLRFSKDDMHASLMDQNETVSKAVRTIDPDTVLLTPVADLVGEFYERFRVNPVELKLEERTSSGAKDLTIRTDDWSGRQVNVDGTPGRAAPGGLRAVQPIPGTEHGPPRRCCDQRRPASRGRGERSAGSGPVGARLSEVASLASADPHRDRGVRVILIVGLRDEDSDNIAAVLSDGSA